MMIEVNRSLSPSVSKGFHIASEDIGASQCYLVYPASERFPLSRQLDAIPLPDLMRLLRSKK